MKFSADIFQRKKSAFIIYVFVFLNIFENVFGSGDVDSIASSFSASYSHILYFGSSFIGAIAILKLFPNWTPYFPRFFGYYLLFAFYAILSSIWSPAPVKSLGLSIILLLNLVMATAIGTAMRDVREEDRFSQFMELWSWLFLVNIVIETIFKGFPANLDEYSLIAFIISFTLFMNKKLISASIFFLLGLSGQSFSAVLAFFLFLFAYFFNSITIYLKFAIVAVFLIVIYISMSVDWLLILENSGFTIFGKDASGIISGSGRFNAWQQVYQAILNSGFVAKLFGHGYASDREVLIASDLTWTVDVHNNLLHICYGLGLVGLLFIVVAFAKSFRLPLLEQFSRFRLAVFASFLFFGLSSSYFFGRPSSLAIFWLTFLTAGMQIGLRPSRVEASDPAPRAHSGQD